MSSTAKPMAIAVSSVRGDSLTATYPTRDSRWPSSRAASMPCCDRCDPRPRPSSFFVYECRRSSTHRVMASGGGDADAAVTRLGLEARRQPGIGAPAPEQPAPAGEGPAAHELAVLLGQAVERAVGQGDLLALAGHRFVAVAGEDAHHRRPPVLALAQVLDRAGRLLADGASRGAGRGPQAVADRSSGSRR